MRCAKRRLYGPSLNRVQTAAAFEGDKLVALVTSTERVTVRGRGFSCKGIWVDVPVKDGVADPQVLARLQRPGLATSLMLSADPKGGQP